MIETRTRPGAGEPPLGGPDTGADLLSPTDRDRILQAMTECCAERGYRETTVEEVLERADVRREDFETFFVGKEDCAVAAIHRVASEVLAAVSLSGGGGSSEIERGSAGVKAILELMAARPPFAGLAYIQARQGGTKGMRDAYESGSRVLTVMLERFGDQLATQPPPRAARAALGGAEAVVRREIAAGRFERLPALLRDFLYCVLVPFTGQEEALRQAQMVDRLLSEEG